MPRVAITSVMPSATSTSGAARFRMSIDAAVEVAVAPLQLPEAGVEDGVDGEQQQQRERRPEQAVAAARARASRSPSGARRDQVVDRLLRAVARQLADLARGRAARRCGPRRAPPRSISDEMNSTAMPPRASARISSMISCLAATSMPRVGSSRISSRGSVASQRASIAFCWLPPESWRDRRVEVGAS